MKRLSAADLRAAIAARRVRGRTARRLNRPPDDDSPTSALLPDEVSVPLTVIIGSAGLLQHCHADFGAAEIEVLAGGILEAALRLHRLAENHTLCAELETSRGAGHARAQPAGAGDVRTAAKEAAFRGGRVCDLVLDVDDVVVLIAPAHLRKIVSELVDNAFRFSPRGTAVQVSLHADGSGCRLEIVDRGPGMAEEQVRRIGRLPRFTRGRRTPRASGTGLTLVRRLAEATDGALEIESRLPGGTSVRVLWRDAGWESAPAHRVQ